MKNYVKFALGTIVIILMSLSAVFSQDIAQFRGENRDGAYDGTNLLEKWPENGPTMTWFSEKVGGGYSAPTVTKDAIYITGKIDSLEYLTAFNKKGEKLWSVTTGKAWDATFPESKCTPTIDNKFVYTVSPWGEVMCFDKKTGKKQWAVEISKQFEGKAEHWGISESLLLVDDKVIFTPAGSQTTMVALNKGNGEIAWKTESLKDTAHYASPIVEEINGKKVIFTALKKHAIAVDAKDGKILCKYEFDKEKSPMNVNTPIFKNGQLCITAGYDNFSYMLQPSKDLSKFEMVWRDTIMDSEYGYVVEKDGYLYGSNFINARKGNWCCIDWKTGKLQYETTWQTKGPLSIAGDKLYCLDEKRGNLALVQADPKEFKVISHFKLPKGKGPCWANPVINDGIMYVRKGSALMAFNIKK